MLDAGNVRHVASLTRCAGSFQSHRPSTIDLHGLHDDTEVCGTLGLGSEYDPTRLAPGKSVGEKAVFGGLFGQGDVVDVRNAGTSSRFVAYGGRIPAPLHSLKN